MNIFDYVIVGSGPSAASALSEILQKKGRILVLDSAEDSKLKSKVMQSIAASLAPGANYKLFDKAYENIMFDKEQSLVKTKFGLAVSRKNNTANEINEYISNTKGGFSEVWGSAILPAPPHQIKKYLFAEELNRYQKDIWNEIPKYQYTKLSEDFKQYSNFEKFDKTEITELQGRIPSQNSEANLIYPTILAINNSGPNKCVNCGKCMTGCPNDAIWSARHWIEKFEDLIEYRNNCLVLSFEEKEDSVIVKYLNKITNQVEELDTRVLFLGTGVIGTSQILLNSEVVTEPVIGKDSTVIQGLHFTKPLRVDTYKKTLSEISISKFKDDDNYQYCQLYRITENAVNALNVGNRILKVLLKLSIPFLERFFVVSFVYFPHEESSSFEIYRNSLIKFKRKKRIYILKNYFKRIWELTKSLFKLQVFPLPIYFTIKDRGQGMHFSSTIPLSEKKHGSNYSSVEGNPADLKRVFIIDASVLNEPIQGPPTIFVMANARRISKIAMDLYG